MATLLGEPMAVSCADRLAGERKLLISAVTLVETLMVARDRKVESRFIDLFRQLPFEIVHVDGETSWRVNEIHRVWGKGRHPARLNLVDCFSYDVAKQFGCPLLYIGDDFSQTDIPSALA